MEDLDQLYAQHKFAAAKINLNICESQGELYSYVYGLQFDIPVFSELFLRSDFCRNCFDTLYSRHHDMFGHENWGYIKDEIGDKIPKISNDTILLDECAYWIGYIYREIVIETKIPSAKIVEIVPFDDIRSFYFTTFEDDFEDIARILCNKYDLERINPYI